MLYTVAMSFGRYLSVLFVGILVGCGAQNSSLPKETLRFNATNLANALTEEKYAKSGFVSGGQQPYRLQLVEGTLPKGMSLNNLELSGTPSEVGNYTFTLEVSDAALSTRQQKFTLVVQNPPPATLKITFPEGMVQSTRVPVVLENFKKVKAGHLEWELPKNINVTAVEAGAGKSLILWKIKDNVLSADFVLTEGLLRDNKVLMLTVNASAPTALRGNVYYQLYGLQTINSTVTTVLVGKQNAPEKVKTLTPTPSLTPKLEPAPSTGSTSSTPVSSPKTEPDDPSPATTPKTEPNPEDKQP